MEKLLHERLKDMAQDGGEFVFRGKGYVFHLSYDEAQALADRLTALIERDAK